MPELFPARGPQRDEDGAILDDAHWTPQACADACVEDLARSLDPLEVRSVREPSAGGGSFVRSAASRWGRATIHGIDSFPDAPGLQVCDAVLVGDFATLPIGPVDITVSNPPFGGPDARRGRRPGEPPYVGAHHVRRMLDTSTIAVGAILPLEWIGVGYVNRELWGPRPPSYARVLTPRPWTVVRACAWFVWLLDEDLREFRIRPPLAWKR